MVEVTYLGHSGFTFKTGKYTLVIDPFLTGNPSAVNTPADIQPDYILVTHGHTDHLGDALQLAAANNAVIIAPHELAQFCASRGAAIHSMHIGGSFGFPFGRVKLTTALHGSAFIDDEGITYTGNPVGFLLELPGCVVYHAGDTGLFSDMKMIGDAGTIDLALLPIGDNFTMGPDDALIAAGWLHPGLVVPMHYNTFEVIEQDPHDFVSRLAVAGIAGRVMTPGETFSL
ncbi:metal-dependent hydrolase [bacterium]|nr:metal-dependent hydrolase [bacterium]